VITEYAQIGSSKDPIEQQLIFDTVNDNIMYNSEIENLVN
jgi:hypothetical protein